MCEQWFNSILAIAKSVEAIGSGMLFIRSRKNLSANSARFRPNSEKKNRNDEKPKCSTIGLTLDGKTIQNTRNDVHKLLCVSHHSCKCAVSHSFKCEFSVNSLQAQCFYESTMNHVTGCCDQLNEWMKTVAVAATVALVVVAFIWLPSGKRFHRSLWHAHSQTNWNGFLLILSRARIQPKRRACQKGWNIHFIAGKLRCLAIFSLFSSSFL